MLLTGFKGAIESIAISINSPEMTCALVSKINENSGNVKHLTYLNRLNHKSDLENLATELPTAAFLRSTKEEIESVTERFQDALGEEVTVDVIPYIKQDLIQINGDDSSVVSLPTINLEACNDNGILVVTLHSNEVWVQDLIMFVNNKRRKKPILLTCPQLLESNILGGIRCSIYEGLLDWFIQSGTNSSNLLNAFTTRNFATQETTDYLIEGGDIIHLDECAIVGSRSIDFNNHLALHSDDLLKTVSDGLSEKIEKHVLFNATPFKHSRFWDQPEDRVFGVTQPLYHLDMFFQAFQYKGASNEKLILMVANPRAADPQSKTMSKQAAVLRERINIWSAKLIDQLEHYFGCIEVREIPLLVGLSTKRTVSFTNGILEITTATRAKQEKIGNYYVANIDPKDDYWELYKSEIFRAEVELVRALPELNIHFIYGAIDQQSLHSGGLHCNVKILQRAATK